MIQITPHMRIFIAVDPTDFRKGIDGLARICKSILNEDPFSGHLFVFRNKKASSLKILMYDGQGFWLFQKRLSKGLFTWWPLKSYGDKYILNAHELQHLLWNGNPEDMPVSKMWRKIQS